MEVKKFKDRTEYYKDGKLHRDNDLPAIEYNDGSKKWYKNGKLHRNNGPAIEYLDSYKGWYKNGKLHRIDGPAREWSNGNKEWYKNNKKHRLCGPAFEYPNGYKEWFIYNKQYTEEEFNKKVKEISKYERKKLDDRIEYYYEGKLHRDNGPAVKYTNGEKFWYIKGINYTEEEFNKKIKELSRKETIIQKLLKIFNIKGK